LYKSIQLFFQEVLGDFDLSESRVVDDEPVEDVLDFATAYQLSHREIMSVTLE
jgi:hypothetical protein